MSLVRLGIVGIVSILLLGQSPEVREWEVPNSLSLEVHSSGFYLPTSIAFIPNRQLEDPLYYVTELNGTVKAVDQNGKGEIVGTVQSTPHTVESEPDEFGTAGICLSDKGRYVFVTYAWKDQSDILRNGVSRLKPTEEDLGWVFEGFASGYGHQVGPCQVDTEEGYLYVGVGDGLQSSSAQDLNDPRGKILRMDFNGHPVKENPFYLDDGLDTPSDYIYALGLRNPFGLKLVQTETITRKRLYVADNGNSIDRILVIREGQNYLWDGTDASIAARNRIILLDSGGTAALDFNQETESFFLVRTKDPARIQSFTLPSQGIETILQSTDQGQILSAMAVGPDGLYFAPLFGNSVLRLKWAEEEGGDEERLSLSPILSGERLVRKYGCQGCHQIRGEGESLGPSLDQISKPEDWIVQKLQDPRFESAESIMPDLGISEGEAETLARWLIEDRGQEENLLSGPIPKSVLGWFLPGAGSYPRRWLVAYFWAGSMVTAMGIGLLWSGWILFRSLRK